MGSATERRPVRAKRGTGKGGKGSVWYEWLSAVSRVLSEPFLQMSHATTIPELSALVLGMVGAFAPCQLTAHVGALAYFSGRAAGERFSASELVWYLVGRMTVYTVLGVAAYLLGKDFGNQLIPLFSWSRKALGPLFLLTGLVMLGWVRWTKGIGGRLESWGTRLALLLAPRGRAFLLGIAFSLGFCPTMFLLFFGILISLMFSSASGPVLPPLFAIGTAVPLLFVFGLLYGTGASRSFVRALRRFGHGLTRAVGAVFVLIGLLDTVTYWTL